MDLRSDHPYWLMKSGMVTTYPSLQQDISVDVAIVGAGISGALIAHYLTEKGISVAVADKRHVGMGSTAASTALLQYEIDTPIRELRSMVGEHNAVRSYQLCQDAITELEQLCRETTMDVAFERITSLQYASYKKHVAPLREEYELRLKHGFDVQWLSAGDIKAGYRFEAPGAILSAVAGSVDAYLLTHALLAQCRKKGQAIYDNTTVTIIDHKTRKVVLHTDTGYKITAKKLVLACGYETLQYIPRQVAKLWSTYALVSERVAPEAIWPGRSLIWETKQPYLYMRATEDNRVIVGGGDDERHDPHLRDRKMKDKVKQLTAAFHKKFSHLSIRPDMYWSGTFATTKDGLPYIGTIPERPNTYFALGFGGNGITFSVMAGQMITDMITGKKNKDAGIFSFNR